MGFTTNAVNAALELLHRGISWTWYFSWTGGKVNQYTFFNDSEIVGLDPELVAMLDMACGLAGHVFGSHVPFVITSGRRTPEQNAALPNAVQDSEHLTGNGVDLACSDSQIRFAMLRGLTGAGFNRIGIYAEHIHAGNSKTLPQNVCWFIESA
jgi:hypothetical protein